MTVVLEGIKVLEIASFVSGPWAAQMLAELGAEVIKVESPDGGDPFRNFSPDGYSSAFCAHNMHKKSITIDLGKSEGRDLLKRLVANFDVLIENFRPGVMDKRQLGWTQLSKINPQLVYCSISGFGADGPYRDRPAYDTVIQALSGVLDQFLATDRPKIAGPNVADSVTSLCAVIGILGALFERQRTNRGHYVEVAMIDSLVAFATNAIAQYLKTGVNPGPYQRPANSQCFVFRCSDNKLIAIHMSKPEKFWRGLLAAVNRPNIADDQRFADNRSRILNYEELGAVLSEIFATRTRSEWSAALEANDVPYATVNKFDEVIADPQVIHRKIVLDMEHPSKGRVRGISRPVVFDGSRDFKASAPPVLGEHTDEVLTASGLSGQELRTLKEKKVI
jgi:crotonobetainyl-CoA:carnitine CoA-transferase CaiB-like acyl-CoA transferase